MKIDICSPKHRTPEGFISVDLFDADINTDLNLKWPFDDSSIDEVRAYDALEHLRYQIITMNEIWRVCKQNAIVDIFVPTTDGRAAFQDPTHVSFWNENSFWYYCRQWPSYLALCQRYGFIGQFDCVSLSTEGLHVKAVLKVVK